MEFIHALGDPRGRLSQGRLQEAGGPSGLGRKQRPTAMDQSRF